MILKTYENFYADKGSTIFQLVNNGVVSRMAANSSDFQKKLNSERNATPLDYLLPLLDEFNQHKDLDFVDFWNKKKNDYKLPSKYKSLKGEDALKKFFVLSKKLKFNNILLKDFFDSLGIKDLKGYNQQHGYYVPDKSRDGSIVVGPEKDNVKTVIKRVTNFQNRKMY